MEKLNVLLITRSWKNYIAKVWWSIHKGLAANCNLYTFGEEQQYFNPNIKSYNEIIDLIPVKIDIMITNFNSDGFLYENIDAVKCKKAIIVGDYWSLPSIFFSNMIHKVDYIFSFFYEFVERHPSMYFLPPSVDLDIFKDWNEPKHYKLGFLGIGCSSPDNNYPERFRISSLLVSQYNSFYCPRHPGWGYFPEGASLIGTNFSKAINRCKMIVNTSGIIKHCNPKYIEFPASGSMLLAGSCVHLDKINFKDGFNCVCFDSDKDLIDKINHYAKYEDERLKIIENALSTIKEFHTSEIRGKQLLEVISK